MRGYKSGTQVQDKTGRVKVKLPSGKWEGRGRYNFNKVVRRVRPHERVFHLDGDRANDNPKNLVAVAFGIKHYDIATSRVVWAPKK